MFVSSITAKVGKRAPPFALQCTQGSLGTRRTITLDDYCDRWLILVFYPRDFSLVCPTELTAMGTRIKEFRRRGCDVLGISTDSIESHERWISAPRAQGGLGEIHFPLASDLDGTVSQAYGVYLEAQHVALRGLFILDPNGVVQFEAVHNLSVGRRSEDVLRILAALETGGMCAEDWCPDCPTIDPTQSLVSGSVISHYRIEKPIGAGTFGLVYRARDLVLERTVALKVFKPGRVPSPRAVLKEARMAAALQHPNICTVYAVDDTEGVPIISMEFVAGHPLNRLLDRGPLSSDIAGSIGRQVASGMAVAHGLGIVHRDLKPANILITTDGVAKITDFGLSHRSTAPAANDETHSYLDPGKVAGTPAYMSPEQVRGEPATAASDVFALGVVLYEMLTGQRAFAGENLLQVLERIRAVEPEQFASCLPGRYARIVRQALVLNPAERTLTMEQFGQGLESEKTSPL